MFIVTSEQSKDVWEKCSFLSPPPFQGGPDDLIISIYIPIYLSKIIHIVWGEVKDFFLLNIRYTILH